MTKSVNRKELEQARKDNADLVKNSGRGMNKGDATLGKYMVDYKFTEKNSYALNLEKFKALEKQAWREDKEAITVAVFEEHRGRTIAMIDWDILKEMIANE